MRMSNGKATFNVADKRRMFRFHRLLVDVPKPKLTQQQHDEAEVHRRFTEHRRG